MASEEQLNKLFWDLQRQGYSPEVAWQMINSGTVKPKAGFLPNIKFGAGQSLLKNFKMPDLRTAARNFRETSIGEVGKSPTIGQAANTLSALYQGGRAVKGLYENDQAAADLDSLKSDVSTLVASNPMYSSYLDPSQEKVLRQMNNGTLVNGGGKIGEGVIKGIPQALLATLIGGVTGGAPGAVIGGVGSLVNSGISGYGQGQQEANSKLQGLYNSLRQANEDYRTMRRPMGLQSAGLQSRYYNQLI